MEMEGGRKSRISRVELAKKTPSSRRSVSAAEFPAGAAALILPFCSAFEQEERTRAH